MQIPWAVFCATRMINMGWKHACNKKGQKVSQRINKQTFRSTFSLLNHSFNEIWKSRKPDTWWSYISKADGFIITCDWKSSSCKSHQRFHEYLEIKNLEVYCYVYKTSLILIFWCIKIWSEPSLNLRRLEIVLQHWLL